MENQENNQTNLGQGGIGTTPSPISNSTETGQMPSNHPMGIPTDNNSNLTQAASSSAQTPPADPPQVSSDQIKETINSGPKHDNKLLIFMIGAALVLVILVIIIVITNAGVGNKQTSKAVPTPKAQIATPTPEQQEFSSVGEISSQKDVENTLEELDKTDPEEAGADLSQNDQDALAF